MDLQDLESKDFISEIGQILKTIRMEKKISLEELSKKTGISRLTLAKIEKGTANPTLNIMWKICTTLEIEFSQLINISEETSISRANKSLAVEDEKNAFRIELMFKENQVKSAEFYRVYLAPQETILTEEHNKGCIETVMVMEGKIELIVADKIYILEQFDSIKFKADMEHSYRNLHNDKSILNSTLIYK
ncbi:MAG: helix-turn-helix domain-containing protein [Sarcina sp.]